MQDNPKPLERHAGYYTAPWRKARICARLFLHPELLARERYRRIAAAFVHDPSVTNRLISQAVAQLQGIRCRRDVAS